MTKSIREIMAAGEWYSCIEDELASFRTTAQAAVHMRNVMHPANREGIFGGKCDKKRQISVKMPPTPCFQMLFKHLAFHNVTI